MVGQRRGETLGRIRCIALAQFATPIAQGGVLWIIHGHEARRLK